MKADRKSIEVIMKSGLIPHSLERLKKRTVRGEKEGGEKEGVSMREKMLILRVIEKVLQRRGFDGETEELGRVADEIENECIEEIERIEEEEERGGTMEEERERELDEWIEMKRLAGSVSTMVVVKKRKGKMMTSKRMIEEAEERMKNAEERMKQAEEKQRNAEEEKRKAVGEKQSLEKKFSPIIPILQETGILTSLGGPITSLSSLSVTFSNPAMIKAENNMIIHHGDYG